MGVLKVLWFLALLQTAAAADEVRCYQCLGISNPEKCTNLKKCPFPNMKCHARQYLVDSVYKYDLDCVPENVCKVLVPDDSPSQKIEIDMWTSCCDENYCNKNFNQHGDIIPIANRNHHCYNCLGVADPADCFQIDECAPGQVCLTRERILTGGAQVFDLMCYKRDDCLRLGYHLPYGKRMTLCRACCDMRDNCNNQFCSRKLGITNMEALGSSIRPNTATPYTTAKPPPATTNVYDQYTLIVTPKTQAGNLNDVISFNCALTPKPLNLGNLTLTWFFSGETGSIFSQTVTDPDLKLTVHTLAQKDAGIYTCEVKNDQHSWRATGELTIGAIANRDHHHCYSCLGVADPADCFQIEECASGQVCLTRERILTGGAQVFDLMCYERDDCLRLGYHLPYGKDMTLCRACCDVQDNCNNQFCSRKLGITNMEALGSSVRPNTATPYTTAKPPPATTNVYDQYTLTVTPKTQVGNLNDVISFNCALTPKTPRLGNLTVTWFFSGESGSIYSKTVTDPDLKLTVHTLAQTDAGKYTCEVKNDQHSWRATGELTIAGTSFLNVVDGPHDQKVLSGRDVTFTCDVQGSPAPEVTWQLVHNSNPPVNITSGVTRTSTGSRLVLKSVQESDAGIYRCLASNDGETKANLAILTVEDSPKIRIGPHSKKVKLNTQVKLECKVSGVPTPTVQWTFVSPSNSKLMPSGTAINMDDSVLISKMTTDHVGTWTCRASNTHGHAEAAAVLNIK